ncbi:MAG: HAD hydrolase-like protein [Flavisolibacter sp.]
MNTDPQPISFIYFDVYGTLIDTTDVKRKINKVLDSSRGFVLWYETLLHYLMVANATTYYDFKEIAIAAAELTAKNLGTNYQKRSFEEALELFRHLPLQEGAQQGLSILYDHGIRLGNLTNFPSSIVHDRLERTGLVSYFELTICSNEIRKYKPDPIVYQQAIQKTGNPASAVMLATMHGWDLCGASHAGMQTALVASQDEKIYNLAPEPGYRVENIISLARQITGSTVEFSEE